MNQSTDTFSISRLTQEEDQFKLSWLVNSTTSYTICQVSSAAVAAAWQAAFEGYMSSWLESLQDEWLEILNKTEERQPYMPVDKRNGMGCYSCRTMSFRSLQKDWVYNLNFCPIETSEMSWGFMVAQSSSQEEIDKKQAELESSVLEWLAAREQAWLVQRASARVSQTTVK